MALDFLPPPDELASNAEWLLQSARAGGQVSPEVLAEALAYEHHEWLSRLGAALLPHAGVAAQPTGRHAGVQASPADRLLADVLAAALVDAHAYNAELGVRPWLASLALHAIQRRAAGQPHPEGQLSGLDLTSRAAAVLRLLCAFSRDELERVAGLHSDWLPRLRSALSTATPTDDVESDTAGPIAAAAEPEPVYPWSRSRGPEARARAAQASKALDAQEQRLADQLRAIYPAPPELPQERLNALAAYAARRAGRRSQLLKRRLAVNEIALVSLAILVVLIVIWGADRLLPPDPDAPRATMPPATWVNYNAGSREDEVNEESRRQPAATFTARWTDHVAYVVRAGDTLESVAEDTGNSVEELKQSNRELESEPLYPGQVLWVHVPAYKSPTADDIIIEPDEPHDPLPPLIGRDPAPAEILLRLRLSQRLWRTLWADYQMVYYGPLRYTSEPRAYRFQVWVSQPDRSLEIFNELSSQPEMRHITLQGRSYTSAVRYSGAYVDPDWKHAPNILLTNPMLRETIFPDGAERFNTTWRMDPEKIEMVAGRSALRVSFYDVSGGTVPVFKLWIDRRYGLILRRQLMEVTTGMVISDMTATQVFIDNPMPASLFNPLSSWEGGFAEGPSGKTAPLDALPPTPTWALPASREP